MTRMLKLNHHRCSTIRYINVSSTQRALSWVNGCRPLVLHCLGKVSLNDWEGKTFKKSHGVSPKETGKSKRKGVTIIQAKGPFRVSSKVSTLSSTYAGTATKTKVSFLLREASMEGVRACFVSMDRLDFNPLRKGASTRAFILTYRYLRSTSSAFTCVFASGQRRLFLVPATSLSSVSFGNCWYLSYEYSAGLIDGDGHFRVTKWGSARLDIKMGSEDRPVLELFKKSYGGSVYPVKGENSYRYVLTNQKELFNLVNGLNGYIRDEVRLPQFVEVCKVLGIVPKEPSKLTKQSAWPAGYFDADGHISFCINKRREGFPSPIIKVTNKYKRNIEPFYALFNGKIYTRSNDDGFDWAVSGREDILDMVDYYEKNPGFFQSRKSRRIPMMREFYRLRDLQAYKEGNPHHEEWLSFNNRWRWKE